MKTTLFVSVVAATVTLFLTTSALAGTVCVYNDAGRSLNVSIVW